MKLQEKRCEFNKYLHMMFVNFEQTHVVIDGIGLWQSFKIQGLPLKSVKTCTQQTRCKIELGKNTNIMRYLVQTNKRL